jgi:hypothetical protein
MVKTLGRAKNYQENCTTGCQENLTGRVGVFGILIVIVLYGTPAFFSSK